MSEKEPAKKVKPTNKIRQKIGPAANVRDLLKPEIVQKGQSVIDSNRENFIEWAQEDIQKLIEILNEIQSTPIDRHHLERIITSAEHLRDQGGTFGYDLISHVAKSLVNYSSTVHSPSPNHAIVVAKHIEGLSTIIAQRIEGSGGMIGIELIKSLTELTQKYSAGQE